MNLEVYHTGVKLIFLFVFAFQVSVLTDASNETLTNSTNVYTPDKTGDDHPKLFKDHFWMIVCVCIFCGLLVISLAVSLVVGIYHFRRYARRHGHTQKNSRVGQSNDEESSTNYDMFTVPSDLSALHKSSSIETTTSGLNLGSS